MLISYSQYPILKAVKENNLSKIPIGSIDMQSFMGHYQREVFNEVFKICNESFRNNIKYISNPFEKAFDKARLSVAGILQEAIFKMDDDAGVLIFGGQGLVLYKLEVKKDYCAFYASIFYKKVIVFSGIIKFTSDGENEKINYWVSNNFTGHGGPISLLGNPLAYLVFMRFAETETKNIDPGKKATVGKEKHKNETELKVRVVGCEWITTIIRSSGFDVRGHFRLQPCGVNHQDRKLIWVNPFQKNGYTRRAQVIVNKEKRCQPSPTN